MRFLRRSSSDARALLKGPQPAAELFPSDDFSVHYPPSSQEDVAWFRNALEHEQRKFFAAFVFQKSRGVPEVLYETMIRAAVYERDPSKNRAFVEPCVATFGLRRVSETLFERFENGSDQEKTGVVQAMYHAGLIGVRDSYWRRPDSDAVFKLVGDLWMRQRCLLLREFVSNPSVLVRQRIIPHLDLTNVSSYPKEFKPLVPQAIQIARNHTDGYIRHRVEIQMGSNETQLFSPLPAMDRSDTEDLPEGGTQESIGRATRSLMPDTTPQIVHYSFAAMGPLTGLALRRSQRALESLLLLPNPERLLDDNWHRD